jgi:hypothetical protein
MSWQGKVLAEVVEPQSAVGHMTCANCAKKLTRKSLAERILSIPKIAEGIGMVVVKEMK